MLWANFTLGNEASVALAAALEKNRSLQHFVLGRQVAQQRVAKPDTLQDPPALFRKFCAAGQIMRRSGDGTRGHSGVAGC